MYDRSPDREVLTFFGVNMSVPRKIFLLIMVALFFVASSVGAQEAEPEQEPEVEAAPGGLTADEVAERIQRFYGATDDFQSAFLQTYTDIAAGETKVSRGRVYFKKPGMMRWDYYQPDNA